MGAFFGLVSARDAIEDAFYGTDYLSHLGTHRAGIACYDREAGLQREIHNIENTPFRTRFEHVLEELQGTSAIACISDFDPQPLLIRSSFGTYALCYTGIINNKNDLVDRYLSQPGAHFDAISGGGINSCELIAALMNMKEDLIEGIRFVQEVVEGTMSLLVLQEDGSIIAVRDKLGRIPVVIGKDDEGMCVCFESFSYQKLGYRNHKELGPGEIVKITKDKVFTLVEAGAEEHICAFLWAYYGYPSSVYDGVCVEKARHRNGELMAEQDQERQQIPNLDAIVGVPDSGIGHALGYALASGVPYARAMVKYTPTWARSFTPSVQNQREKVARMKMIPVHELINDQKLLFVDDSIVRGTQLAGTVGFLYRNGAKEVHMRSATPPTMHVCKFLGFSRTVDPMELLTRRTILALEGEEGLAHLDEYADGESERGKAMRAKIAEQFHFSSLEFQSLENLIESIGLDPCRLCTYCWTGKESE